MREREVPNDDLQRRIEAANAAGDHELAEMLQRLREQFPEHYEPAEPPPPFQIEEHTTRSKRFRVVGPGDLTLYVDFDDVNHREVDALVEQMVRLVNEGWEKFKMYECPDEDCEGYRQAVSSLVCPVCGTAGEELVVG